MRYYTIVKRYNLKMNTFIKNAITANPINVLTIIIVLGFFISNRSYSIDLEPKYIYIKSSYWLKPDFDKIYPYTGSVPPEIIKRVPADAYKVFKQGNKEFFKPLKKNQPKMYKLLTQDCGKISVMDRSFKDFREKKEHLYNWVIPCGKLLIVAGIPIGPIDPREPAYQEYFNSIPVSLHGYYKYMDGMSIPFETGPSIHDYDFPGGIGVSWRTMDNIYLKFSKKQDSSVPLKIDNYKTEYLRAPIYMRDGRIFIINMKSKTRNLYLMRKNSLGKIKLIKNPARYLDDMFVSNVKNVMQLLQKRKYKD